MTAPEGNTRIDHMTCGLSCSFWQILGAGFLTAYINLTMLEALKLYSVHKSCARAKVFNNAACASMSCGREPGAH